MSIARVVCLVGIAVSLTACSSAPTSRQLGQDAIDAMGGAERVQRVNTLTMKGGVVFYPSEIYEALGIKPFTGPLRPTAATAASRP